MKADKFISLLGRTSEDSDVKAFLKNLGITKQPKLKRGLSDAIVESKKLGVEITFTDERALDVPSDDYEEGALVLSNIRSTLTAMIHFGNTPASFHSTCDST